MLISLVMGALVVPAPPAVAADGDLASPPTKEIAMQLVSSAENSSLDWKRQYRYIEDIGDGRAIPPASSVSAPAPVTCSRWSRPTAARQPDNPLARFLPALRAVNGTDSHAGLGRPFVKAWRTAAKDPVFRRGPGPGTGRHLLRPRGPARQEGRPRRSRPVRVLRRRSCARVLRPEGPPQARPAARQSSVAGRVGGVLAEGVPRRADTRDEEGARTRRAARPHHQDAAPVPARGQPRPGPASALDGQRHRLPDRLVARLGASCNCHCCIRGSCVGSAYVGGQP